MWGAASVLGVVRGAWIAWMALPGPVRGFLMIGVAASTGLIWGELDGRRRCDLRIRQSIEQARAIDARVSAEAKAIAEQQQREGAVRESAIRDEVARYTDELASKVVSACTIGADADRNNDGLRLQNDAAPAAVAKPAPGRARHSGPGAVPAGQGHR